MQMMLLLQVILLLFVPGRICCVMLALSKGKTLKASDFIA